MKRIHYILIIIFFSTDLFSQYEYWGEKSIITKQEYQKLEEKTFNDETKDYIYGFIANNEFFVLAYRIDKEHKWIKQEKEKVNGWINDTTSVKYIEDTSADTWIKQEFTKLHLQPNGSYWDAVTQTAKRDLILYRSKNGKNWVEASNTVQTDYRISGHTFTFTEKDPKVFNFEYHSYLITKGLGSGKVRILNNGCVLMLLCNEYNKYLQNYNAVVIFVPNFDKTYTATRFEPLKKETRVPELRAGDTLIIHETKNEIYLEFWERYVCKENENPDDFIIYNSDTGGKDYKVFYKRKLFTTLNFIINNGTVFYIGDYELISKE